MMMMVIMMLLLRVDGGEGPGDKPALGGSPQVLIEDLGGNFDDNGDYDDAVDGYISLSIISYTMIQMW